MLATISCGILFSFCFDFIAELNKAWSWNGGLLFGKIFGVVQIDVMIWFFLWVLHIFLFYEHFIDASKFRSLITKRGKISFGVGGVLFLVLVLIFESIPQVLLVPKAYLMLCLLVTIAFVVAVAYRPKILRHAVLVVPYFFLVYISHEITALKLAQWNFPGDYVGLVHLFGVGFPIEEMVFWIILSPLIGSVFYEVVFDNSKN